MRILVEPSDFVLHNSVDAAMLEVGVTRLSSLFPHASINVLSNTPDTFPRWASNVRPIAATGYHAGVFALALGVPVVGRVRSQYYIDKFQGLAHQFGVGCEVILLDTPDLESKIATAIERAWRSAETVRPQPLAAAARQVELQRAAYRHLCKLVSARGLLTS